MGYLNGNYDLTKRIEDDAPPAEETVKTFEEFARQRLGGSIAFVMKQKTFIWTGQDASPDKGGGDAQENPGASRASS